jgi:hypothetical protein
MAAVVLRAITGPGYDFMVNNGDIYSKEAKLDIPTRLIRTSYRLRALADSPAVIAFTDAINISSELIQEAIITKAMHYVQMAEDRGADPREAEWTGYVYTRMKPKVDNNGRKIKI